MNPRPGSTQERLLLALADLGKCCQGVLASPDHPSPAVQNLLQRLDELDHAIVEVWVEQAIAYPEPPDADDNVHSDANTHDDDDDIPW